MVIPLDTSRETRSRGWSGSYQLSTKEVRHWDSMGAIPGCHHTGPQLAGWHGCLNQQGVVYPRRVLVGADHISLIISAKSGLLGTEANGCGHR